jgi:ABC-2 type transport system permease protein
MKKYITLLKRECWENRFSFFIAPLILAGLVMLLATFISVTDCGNGNTQSEISINGQIWDYTCNNPSEVAEGDEAVYEELNLTHANVILDSVIAVGTLFSILLLLIFASYSLVCLQDEQKNNSILFWNSFPVSHTEAVLIKVFTASVMLPAITLVAVLMTQLLLIVVVWLRLMGTDSFEHLIWPNLRLMDIWLSNVLNIFVFALGSLSTVGLLLTISATGYRAFILLALTLLSLAAISFLITGDSTTVIRFLFIDTLVDSTSLLGSTAAVNGDMPASVFSGLAGQAIETLQNHSFWLSILIGVVMVIAAINMRKYRSEV